MSPVRRHTTDPFSNLSSEVSNIKERSHMPEELLSQVPKRYGPEGKPAEKLVSKDIPEHHANAEVEEEYNVFGDPEPQKITVPDNQYVPIFHHYIEKGLQGQKLLLYALICSRVMATDKHEFKMGKNAIAAWLGINDPANVRKLMVSLKNDGYIILSGEKEGKYGTNIYTLPKDEIEILEQLFHDAFVLKFKAKKKAPK